jgi:hypothetical protein
MTEEQPSYYAIIPATVRYDGNLSSAAKLLYGEITALCNKSGYCWATNDYFAKLYGTSERSVSRWISQLTKEGHINMRVIANSVGSIRHLCLPPLDKSGVHNITSNITSKKDSDSPNSGYKAMQDLVPQFMAALGIEFPPKETP